MAKLTAKSDETSHSVWNPVDQTKPMVSSSFPATAITVSLITTWSATAQGAIRPKVTGSD